MEGGLKIVMSVHFNELMPVAIDRLIKLEIAQEVKQWLTWLKVSKMWAKKGNALFRFPNKCEMIAVLKFLKKLHTNWKPTKNNNKILRG